MLGCSAAVAVNRSGGANTVVFADVAGMWAKLLPHSWNKAIWTFSPSVVPDLLQLKDGANRAIFISLDQGVTKTPNGTCLARRPTPPRTGPPRAPRAARPRPTPASSPPAARR